MRKFEFWTIAYRKRVSHETLLDNLERPFRIVPNTWRYWCADPFLFEKDERTYLFAEMYDRVLRQGVIGCCVLDENGATPWKRVLKMPWHLSYPNVFVNNGQIYMIPESYVNNEIALYKAVDFPYRWKRLRRLADICAVDSTILRQKEKLYLLAQELIDGKDNLTLFEIGNNFKLSQPYHIGFDGDKQVRPAGDAFLYQGKYIRPAQDCSNGYGCALNLNEIESLETNGLREKNIRKVRPSDINSNVPYKPQGIHTYNCTSMYEVIDLKGFETDYLAPIMRIVWGVWRRIKRLWRKA